MVRGDLPECKGGKLHGCDREITMVIVGINFANAIRILRITGSCRVGRDKRIMIMARRRKREK